MGDLRGRRIFLNEDGPDSYAKEINDGRPGYTEPSFDQAAETGEDREAGRPARVYLQGAEIPEDPGP